MKKIVQKSRENVENWIKTNKNAKKKLQISEIVENFTKIKMTKKRRKLIKNYEKIRKNCVKIDLKNDENR